MFYNNWFDRVTKRTSFSSATAESSQKRRLAFFSILTTFAPKNFPHSDFFQTFLLQLDNDQLMSEKQKKLGVTMLASDKKHIGNVMFLEALAL